MDTGLVQLTRVAIVRPVFMLMVIGALLVVGVVSWSRLGVDLMPALDFPIVVVTTVYPGASPDAVNTLVTRPIEDAVATVNDIDYIQSTSIESLSSVVIFFTDKAARDSSIDVQRHVAAIRGTLPSEAREPSISKYDPNAQPVLQLTLSGKQDLGVLQRLAEDKIQKRLQAANGVAEVRLIGGLQREIQVQVNEDRLQARGLSILQINQALGADNLNVPAGTLTELGKDWTVRLDNQAQTPDALKNVLVASTPSGPIYLRDVASVVDTYRTASTINRANGQPAVAVTVIKQASANTVQTTDAVKKVLAQIRPQLPADVSLTIASDASIYTRSSLSDVQRELGTAVVLTGLVLLVFLHTLRSTFIVLLAIPTSLIATLGVMYALGFTLNMMSLMGLTLTVGILVDDSIVVLENIFRHLHLGKTPKDAALYGRSEIGFAAIAITLVDVVVFAPIGFMSSYVGQYMRQFGLVVVAATLFSLFISFTLTPMLASRWFERERSESHTTSATTRNPLTLFGRAWDAGYERLASGYAGVLHFAIGARSRWTIVALGLVSFAGGVLLVAVGILSTEFMPDVDNGEFQVTLEMPAGSALEVTDAAAQKIEQRIMALPEVRDVFASVGVNNNGAIQTSQARFASFLVELKARSQRTRTPTQLSEVVRDFGTDIPGARVTAAPLSMFGPGGASIMIRIQGDDQATLRQLARQVATMVRGVPGTRDVDDGGVGGAPELKVSIDRDRAADLGLTPGQVAGVLRTGLGGTTVSTFRPAGTSGWDITVSLNPDERARVDQVNQMPILTPRGQTVRINQVAQVTLTNGPTRVTTYNRQQTVYVSGYVAGRPTGDVAGDIQVGLNRMSVPSGYTISQGGLAETQSDSFGQVFQALALSVLLMYMLMTALFEGPLYPLIIMFSLPLAAVGAFGLLTVTGNTLNMLSLIGLVLLTGLVGKNAILLVDYTNTLRKRGVGRNEALLQAGPTRLRPILMTTAALVLAMTPIALKLGEGSELRAPMAVTVIGGLLTSTLLTLVFIPAVYTIFDDLTGLLGRVVRPRSGRRASGARAAPGSPRPRRAPSPALPGTASTLAQD